MKMLTKYWNYVSNLLWLETLVFQHLELELMTETYITVITFIFDNTTMLHHPISEAYLSGRIPVLPLKESTDQALWKEMPRGQTPPLRKI